MASCCRTSKERQHRQRGGGHRGTRDGVGRRGGTEPGRGDTNTGSKDLNARTLGGERGNLVSLVRGSDGQGVGGTRGRTSAGILGRGVTGSDDQGSVGLEETTSGIIDGLGFATTEGHVDDRLSSDSTLSSSVHTGNDAGGGSRTARDQDLNTDDRDLLATPQVEPPMVPET